MKFGKVVRALSMAVCLLFAAIGVSTTAEAQEKFDADKAFRLYNEVLIGNRKFESLTESEKRQVLRVHQALIAGREDNGSEDCKHARNDAESAANELEYDAQKLANCASRKDLDNNCESEFRKTKNAFEEYNSAVSDVDSECD
jgi:hypothetical protein